MVADLTSASEGAAAGAAAATVAATGWVSVAEAGNWVMATEARTPAEAIAAPPMARLRTGRESKKTPGILTPAHVPRASCTADMAKASWVCRGSLLLQVLVTRKQLATVWVDTTESERTTWNAANAIAAKGTPQARRATPSVSLNPDAQAPDFPGHLAFKS